MSTTTRARALAVVVAGALATIQLLLHCNLPQIYSFAVDPDLSSDKLSAFFKAPVFLDDDPMITMRTALFVIREGWPFFNSGDLAQASTSYLMPYLAAGLFLLFPANHALLAVSALGLTSTLVVLLVLVLSARSLLWGCFLATLLLLTSTASLFSAQGWDHVFQAPLIVLACLFLLRSTSDWRSELLAPLLLVLGCAMRPDAGIIAVAALLSRFVVPSGRRLKGLVPLGIFLGLSVALLGVNHAVFGHFTPTTSRLKLGAAPGLDGVLGYVLENAVLSYSALSAALLLLGILWICRARLEPAAVVLVMGCVLTLLYAVVASDAFAGFRMAWTAACVLALVAAVCLDPPVQVRSPASTSLALVGLFLFAALSFPVQFAQRVKAQRQLAPWSETAQQYALTQWVNRHLQPDDGAIGWYQLGSAFFLPDFQAADFLGKADEAIAALPPHSGQKVGHNKWNIALTMQRWTPQAIVHPWAGDLALAGERRDSAILHARDEFQKGSYSAHTLFEPSIQQDYLACVPTAREGTLAWGLLLQRELAQRHGDSLTCLPIDRL